MQKKTTLLLTIALSLSTLFSGELLAKELFVSTNGNDSVTYVNNNINSPWRTVNKAWADALTDDVVYYRTGTYSITARINVASGGHNVKHTNYNNESVTWASGLTTTVIEVGEPNITVDGINVSSAVSSGDGGFFRIGWNSNGSSPSGFTLRNCTGTSTGAGDNTGIVHGRPNGGGYAENTLIENCTFTGPGSEIGAANSTAIIMFKGRNWTVRNNVISGFYTGLFYNKHPDALATSDGLVENNYIYGCHTALRTHTNKTDFINNIFNGNIYIGYDGGYSDIDGNVGSDFNLFQHNTIIGNFVAENQTRSTDNSYPGSYGNIFLNNIILVRRGIHPYGSTPHGTVGDNNLLNNGDVVQSLGAFLNLTEWQQSLGGCSGIGNECNSITGAPIFVGGVNPNSIDGFTLTSSSLGYKAGSDRIDMGANTSTVGVGSGGSVPPPSASPPSQVQGFQLTNTSLPPQTNLISECKNYQTVHPEWIFCDDFSSTDQFVRDGRYCQYNNNNGEFVTQESVGVQGSRGMQVIWQQSEVDAGNLVLGFGRNPSSYMDKGIHSTEDFREVYYRMYLKNEAGWVGSPYKLSRMSVVSGSDWSQAMIAHLWSSNTGDNTLVIDPASCVENGVVQCTGWNDFNNLRWLGKVNGVAPVFATEQAEQWKCIEVHVKLNTIGQSNGIQEFWIDGQLQASRSDLNYVGTYSEYALNYLAFENYWNGGSPKTQRRYFDNIVVSKSRIGC